MSQTRQLGRQDQISHYFGLCSKASRETLKRMWLAFGFCMLVKMDFRIKNEDLRGKIGVMKKFRIKMVVPRPGK